MLLCSKCKQSKEDEEFSFDPTALIRKGRAYWCRVCAASNARRCHKLKATPEWKEKRAAQGRMLRLSVKQKAVELLGGKCMDCDNIYPMSVYDFHHVNPESKDLTIGKYKIWGDKLLAELKKCILLCANCHRIRHFEEGKCDEGSY